MWLLFYRMAVVPEHLAGREPTAGRGEHGAGHQPAPNNPAVS